MAKLGLAVFGQELYFEESVRAIESFPDVPEHDRLSAKIADLLTHPSETTRLRVATKIVQRFFKSASGRSHPVPFLKLVNAVGIESSRRDLLYWRTARTDTVIAAIARDILYPYFVLNTIPDGYDEASFRMANTSALFSIDRIISRDFAVHYAKNIWAFDSARTVTLALRIMKQAQILDAISVKLGRRHVLGYYPEPRSLQPEVFAYCMYEEFLDRESAPLVSLNRVQNGDCAKLFLRSPLQVESLLRQLQKRKLVEYVGLPGVRHIRFTSPDLGALTDTLAPDSPPKGK